MPFQLGNTYGKGRPKKTKKQAKDWIKAHPYAVATLLDVLYQKGLDGDREAAMYVVDRIKGKPRQQTDIDVSGGNQLGAGLVVELFKILTERQRQIECRTLQIGGYDVQRQSITEGSEQNSEPEV